MFSGKDLWRLKPNSWTASSFPLSLLRRIIGGQRNHHSDRDQALYLANALEDTGRPEVMIVEEAS